MLSLQIKSNVVNQNFLNSLKELVLSVDPLAKISIQEDDYDEFLDTCLEANKELKKDLKTKQAKTYTTAREMFEDIGY